MTRVFIVTGLAIIEITQDAAMLRNLNWSDPRVLVLHHKGD